MWVVQVHFAADPLQFHCDAFAKENLPLLADSVKWKKFEY